MDCEYEVSYSPTTNNLAYLRNIIHKESTLSRGNIEISDKVQKSPITVMEHRLHIIGGQVWTLDKLCV